MEVGAGSTQYISGRDKCALFLLFLQALTSPPHKNYLKKENYIEIYLYIWILRCMIYLRGPYIYLQVYVPII